MKKEMTLEQLIKRLDKTGWKQGIRGLEALHKSLEERQAYLYSGDQDEVHQASKMGLMLLKQDETLIKLRLVAKERGISLE